MVKVSSLFNIGKTIEARYSSSVFKIVGFYLLMDYEATDMKILELINRGQNTFGAMKMLLKLKNEELEKTLDILDQTKLVTTGTKTGLLGQKKIIINITEAGTKKNNEYIEMLAKKWHEMLDLAIAGERATLDQMIVDNPFLVNTMVFFGVTDLPTLSRLNLRFLLEGKHLCYECKKELKRFSQKFSVSDVRKFNFKLPRGMTTRDDLCADCFNKLPPAPMSG